MADLSDIWTEGDAAPQPKKNGLMEGAGRFVRGETNAVTPTAAGLGEAGLAMATGVPAWLYGRLNKIAVSAMTGDAEKAQAVEEETVKRYSYEPKTEFGRHLAERAGAVMEPLFAVGEEIRKQDVKAEMPTKAAVSQLVADILVPAKVGKAAKAIAAERGTFGAKPEIKTAADYARENKAYAEGETAKAQEKTFFEGEEARAGSPGAEEYGIPEYREALKERVQAEGVNIKEEAKADLSDIWAEGEAEAFGTTEPMPDFNRPAGLPSVGAMSEGVPAKPVQPSPLPEGAAPGASRQTTFAWQRGAQAGGAEQPVAEIPKAESGAIPGEPQRMAAKAPEEPAPQSTAPGRAGIGNQRGQSPLISDLSELGFEVFSDLAESTGEAIKIAAKEAPKVGAFAGEREKGKYAVGDVVKHRTVTGAKGETLKAPPVFAGEKTIMQEIPELPRKPMGGWTENPLRTFEQMGTKVKELIYRPVKQAEKQWHQEMTDLRAELKDVRKGVSWLSGDRIGAYAIAQQAKGKALLDAMGKEAPVLTPKEMEVYNWMRGKLDGLYARLQTARQISGLEPFGKVENYFTFFNDLSILQEMGFNPITAPMAAMEEAFVHLKATPFGFAKKRTGDIHPIKTDAFLVFDRYADKALQHINLSPAVAKGRELVGAFDDGFLLKNEKPNAAKFLTDWLDFVAGQKPPQPLPPTVERGLQVINKNLAFSILSANLRSAIIQPSSLVNTWAEIGLKHTMDGIKGLMEFSEGKRSAVGEAMKKSNVLLGREFDVNVMESMASVKGALSGVRQKAGNAAMKPLQFLDMETARATWIGAYRKAKSEGKAELDAVNYADDTVTRTQASAQRSDVSPVQRTAIGKTLTLFQTFTINNFGFLTRDVLGIGNKAITNKEAFIKATRWIVGATLINSLFEDVLGTQSPLPSPIHEFIKAQDDGKSVTESSIRAALEGATVAPFLGGARFGSSPFGATADFAKDVVVKLSDQKGPKKSWPELAGKAFGVPGTAQVAKTVRGLEHGKTVPEAILGTEKRSTMPSRKLRRASGNTLRSIRGLD